MVKLFTEHLPRGHESIHVLSEAIVVGSLKDVHHLVKNDVFQAFHVFLSEFEVEPNAALIGIAGPPLGLHTLYTPLRYFDTQDRFPLTNVLLSLA